MLIKSNVTVYTCEFCKKKLFVRGAMERHEKWCYRNPENKQKCFELCKYLEVRKEYISGYDDRMITTFYCTAKREEVYTVGAVKKDLPNIYPEHFGTAVLMPSECNDYKFMHED